MKNKKILLIINSLTNGGAEKAINLLAKRLKENNKVYLVAIDASNPDYEPNVELLDLQIKYTQNKIKTFLYQENVLTEFYVEDIKNNNQSSPIIYSYLNNMHDTYKINNTKERIVIDYIAGMTDDYFLSEYARIKSLL